jgi:ribosomal-protein-alanine N-acetyltransferase
VTAPFQIRPATPDQAAELHALDQLCYAPAWDERLLRSFIVAASLPKKGYLASVLRTDDSAIGYAFASRQEGQLLIERLGVRPEHRRQKVAAGLMATLIFAARSWKLPAVTCSLCEENLDGQLFLKHCEFRALPLTDVARGEKIIQFARDANR